LKGTITNEVYERFSQTFNQQLEDIKAKQGRLDDAEKHYTEHRTVRTQLAKMSYWISPDSDLFMNAFLQAVLERQVLEKSAS